MNINLLSRRGTGRANLAVAIALLALIAATTGTAYAAVAARNSVISSSIKNGQVKAVDIAEGGVTGRRVKDGSIKRPDIADDQIISDHILAGAVGGEELSSIATVEAVSDATQDADGTTNGGIHGIADVSVTCPTGTRILSGGATWSHASNAGNYDRNVYIQSSHMDGNGWHARGIVDFGAAGNIRLMVQAYCLTGGNLVLTAQ